MFVETVSSISYCKNGCSIKQGEKHIRVITGSYMGHPTYENYCKNCAEKMVKETMKQLYS